MKKFILSIIMVIICNSNVLAQATCATAIAISQAAIPYTTGAISTCGSGNDYGVGGSGCNGTYGGGEDYVFALTITSAPVTYSFNIGGAATYKICQIFTACPSPAGTPTNCLGSMVTGAATTATANFTFPSTGTYYIVMDCWPNPTCGTFSLGIYPLPTCPGGLGTGVTNIASLPYSSGAGTNCGDVNNITTANVAKVCGSTSYYTGEDEVFVFTAGASGNSNINLTSGGSWTGLMLYKGCPFSATSTCMGTAQGSTGNKALTVCLEAGQIYYLLYDSWSTPVCNAYSDISISAPGTATGLVNDVCAIAAPLTASGTYTSVTTNYSPDTPGNITSVFCGSIENNQWFTFVATAATATFSFSNITGCTGGIQAQVFSVGTTTSGICTTCNSFTSVSTPCYYPGNTTSGSVVATGLTIGATYYLMIDGNAGAACNFQLNNWSAPTLPVDILSFEGKNYSKEVNKLDWSVAQETKLDYYLVMRSFDGAKFTELDRVYASSSITNQKKYAYYDRSFSESVNYYKLKIVDKDGSFKYSSLVAINSDSKSKFSVNKIFPNPANNSIFASVDSPDDQLLEFQILDFMGKVVFQDKQNLKVGSNVVSINLESFRKGIYYFKFNCGNETKVEKFSLQ